MRGGGAARGADVCYHRRSKIPGSACKSLISLAHELLEPWWPVSATPRRPVVNPVRAGRQQRQRRCRVPELSLARAASISRPIVNVFPSLKGGDFRPLDADVPARDEDIDRRVDVPIMPSTASATDPVSHYEALSTLWAAAR